MRRSWTSWSRVGLSVQLRLFRHCGGASCHGCTGSCHRERVVATARHPAQPHLLRRNAEREDVPRWLHDNAISYVAVSKGPYDWAATDEAALVRRGFLPYLEPVGWDATWTLYAVRNARPVVQPPGRVIARDAVSLTLDLPSPGEYQLRVHWSRYLSASNGCVRPADDGWTTVVADQPGTVKIEGSWMPRHC